MTFCSARKKMLKSMQKLQNEEEKILVLTSQLVRILRDRSKSVRKGLMNIMGLVRDDSCVSLLEILNGLITLLKNVGPRISLINYFKIQKLIIKRTLKTSDITNLKETKSLRAQVINHRHREN
jgi:hypothetical protein